MKAKDFIVAKRPTLAKVTKHPSIGFANYERRLESMQSVMQSIQQAYLGTRERRCPSARGTTRISENKIAASNPKRRIGCKVISAARFASTAIM